MFRFSAKRITRIAGAIASLLLLGALSAAADVISDPTNDFLPSFTGPHNGDLDAVSAQVFFDGANFTFTSTLNGIVGTTPTGLYVWGIDRGAGTVGFPAIASGVTFDAIFAINPAGTSTVRDLISGTATNISAITVSGATVTGVVPASALPSRGLAPTSFLVNLWPRSGAGGNNVIADFAPDNSDAGVTVLTPEPATLGLFSAASVAALALLRRRTRTLRA